MSISAPGDLGLDSPNFESLAQVTLGRRVAEAIRADILFGRLEPGTRLAQQQLCERFGISRMPVRDALRQLTYEGYLLRDSGRHCVVARMSRQDIIDTFELEGLLHGFAAARVAHISSDEELQQLSDLHEHMSQSVADVHRFASLNWEFHRRINQMANSRKVIAALKTLAMAMPRDFVTEFPEWVPQANEEHAHIVSALVARKSAEAQGLVREHIGSSGIRIANYLETKGVALD